MGLNKEVENVTDRNDAGIPEGSERTVQTEKDTGIRAEDTLDKEQITEPNIFTLPEEAGNKRKEVIHSNSEAGSFKTVCCVCSESILLSESLPLWADSRTLSHFGCIITKVLNLAKCEVSLLCCCVPCSIDVMTCFRLQVQIHVSTVIANRRSGRLSLPEALDQGCHICGTIFPTVEKFTDHFVLHIVKETEQCEDYLLLSTVVYGSPTAQESPITTRMALKRKAAVESKSVLPKRKLAPKVADTQNGRVDSGRDKTWLREMSRKTRGVAEVQENTEPSNGTETESHLEYKIKSSGALNVDESGRNTERLQTRYDIRSKKIDGGPLVDEEDFGSTQKVTKRGRKKRGNSRKERFLCHLCGLWRLKVKSQQHMEFHRKFPDAKPQKDRILPQIQKKKTKRETAEKPEPISLTCEHCGVDFDRRFFLVNHLVVRHGESLSEMRRRYSKNMKREPWKCGVCAKEINGIKPLRRHCDDQHAGEGFVQLLCEACPSKVFINDNLLRLHVRSVHDERRSNCEISSYLCEVCSVRCSSATSLGRHKRLRHQNGSNSDEVPQPQPRSFRCQYCEELFYSAVKFRRHIVSKHDPNYQCKSRKSREST